MTNISFSIDLFIVLFAIEKERVMNWLSFLDFKNFDFRNFLQVNFLCPENALIQLSYVFSRISWVLKATSDSNTRHVTVVNEKIWNCDNILKRPLVKKCWKSLNNKSLQVYCLGFVVNFIFAPEPNSVFNPEMSETSNTATWILSDFTAKPAR